MSRIDEIIEAVGQSRFISTLDLTKGYYQIRMKEKDVDKTAFVCHEGQFAFNIMPFGLGMLLQLSRSWWI